MRRVRGSCAESLGRRRRLELWSMLFLSSCGGLPELRIQGTSRLARCNGVIGLHAGCVADFFWAAEEDCSLAIMMGIMTSSYSAFCGAIIIVTVLYS